MKAAYILVPAMLVALVVIANNGQTPVIPPAAHKLIVTSPDLAGASSLQQYLADHSDIELCTTDVIYQQASAPQQESPLVVSAIQSLSLTGTHNAWAKLYVLVSLSLESQQWTVAGYWNKSGYYSSDTFYGSRIVRFMSYGMVEAPGQATLIVNGGAQVTVTLDRSGEYYHWGTWCLSVTGKLLYSYDDPQKIYNYVWARNPTSVLLLGTASRVPAFWAGWVYEVAGTYVVQDLTDHPYSVRNIGSDSLLYRTIPIGRIPVSTAAEVNVVIGKINGRQTALFGRSTVVRDLLLGYNYEAGKIAQALSSLGSSYPVHSVESGTLEAALVEVNSGNDFVVFGGHGSPTSISCCTPSFTVSSLSDCNFQSSSIGISYACYSSDLDFVGSFAEKFITAPSCNGHAFIGWSSLTDVSALAFVAEQFILNYCSVGEGKAFMDGMNLLESMWAIWRGDSSLRNDMHVLDRLFVQFFGCPW